MCIYLTACGTGNTPNDGDSNNEKSKSMKISITISPYQKAYVKKRWKP